MMKKVTVRQTGTSISATIPHDIAQRLKIKKGDTLFAVETADGVLFTPYDPTFDHATRVYERIAKQYQVALRELAR